MLNQEYKDAFARSVLERRAAGIGAADENETGYLFAADLNTPRRFETLAAMLAKLHTFSLLGIDALPVVAEVEVAQDALPKTVLVGLPEQAVKESVHRIERALVNSGFVLPSHRIVINLAYDWSARRVRSAGPLEAVVEKLASSSSLLPERVVERHEQESVVADAIASLPFKQRIVVILYYLHDMDLSEIAEVLSVPEGTVKSRLYYARGGVRAHLLSDSRLSPVGAMSYASTEPPVA